MFVVAWFMMGSLALAQTALYDLPVNSSLSVTTIGGANLPKFFGPPEHYYAVFKIWPVVPGKRYEATLTFDAGDNTYYGMSWIDGDPWGKDYFNFVGIGTGTGTKHLPGKEAKFLFSIHPGSTSNVIYVLLRSNQPWKIKFSVTDKLSGVNRGSMDKWGYYYVDDFDESKTSPFLLKRGGMMADKASPGPSSVGVQFFGPFRFVTPTFQGTVKFLKYSPEKGVAWLRVDGTGVEEILEVDFKGGEFSFIRVLDCRFGKDRPIFQKFTGTFLGDGFVQGGYSGSDQPSSIFPWQGQKN